MFSSKNLRLKRSQIEEALAKLHCDARFAGIEVSQSHFAVANDSLTQRHRRHPVSPGQSAQVCGVRSLWCPVFFAKSLSSHVCIRIDCVQETNIFAKQMHFTTSVIHVPKMTLNVV